MIRPAHTLAFIIRFVLILRTPCIDDVAARYMDVVRPRTELEAACACATSGVREGARDAHGEGGAFFGGGVGVVGAACGALADVEDLDCVSEKRRGREVEKMGLRDGRRREG